MMYIEGLVERRKNKSVARLGRLENADGAHRGCFDPAGIECLAAAYEDVCTELHVTVTDRALKEIVANTSPSKRQVQEAKTDEEKKNAQEELYRQMGEAVINFIPTYPQPCASSRW